MCLVHLFYCVDCQIYSKILSEKSGQLSQRPVKLFTDVVCVRPQCSRRIQAFTRSTRNRYDDCFNPLCDESTCSVVGVPKSCRGNWEVSPKNLFSVRTTSTVSGKLKHFFLQLERDGCLI